MLDKNKILVKNKLVNERFLLKLLLSISLITIISVDKLLLESYKSEKNYLFID